MRHRWSLASGMMAILTLGAQAQDAAEPKGQIAIEVPKRDAPVDFRADVLPFLKTNCIACHHAKDPEGQLVLETAKTILKGGESGPAVVPGKSAQSLMLTSASHQKKPFMPPRKNKVGAGALSPQQLGLIKLWIDQGAKESKLPEIEAPHWQPVTSNWHPIYAVGLDPEGLFAACGRAGHLFLYNVATRRLIDQPSDPSLAPLVPQGQPGLADRDAILSMAFSPDGTLLATGGYRSIRLWKKAQSEKKTKLDLPADARAIALSPDGKKVAMASAKHQIQIFDVREGKMLSEIKGHAGPVASLRFSADGSLLVSGSADKSVRIWKTQDGSPAGKVELPVEVTAVEWLADDKQVAAGGADGMIRVWNVPDASSLQEGSAAPKPQKELKSPATELRAAAGGLLAAASDGKITLWNLETGKSVREIAHGAPLVSLAVSPDGKRWLTVGGPSAILWNAEDGKKVAELRTDGPAARRDRSAQALLAFAGTEVTFRQNAVKAVEEVKKKEEAEVKVAGDAIAPAEKAAKDKEEALAKARQDRIGAERAVAESGLAVETAREKLELCVNALALTDPEQALRQAEADNAAVVQFLEEAQKNPAMMVDARIRAESAGRMMQFGHAGLAVIKAQADKASAERRLAEATAGAAAPRAAAEAATAAASDAKAKGDAARKAVEEAQKKLESVTAPEDKKAAEAALAKLQSALAAAVQAAQAAETARTAASASSGDAAKKVAEATAAVASADAAIVQSKNALAQAQKALADARASADAAISAAEKQKTAALPKIQTSKKAEDAAQNASEIARANLESAKGRVEKAKESVVAADKSIQEANARLEEQKRDQQKLDGERKQAAEALLKSRIALRSGAFSPDSSLVMLGAEDGSLFLFGAERGTEAGVSAAHTKAIVAVGGGITSVASDGSARICDLMPTWKLHTVIEPTEASKPPVDRVLALAFSPDGKVLASGGGIPSRDGELVLWNPADGSFLREIAGAHSDTVFDIAFSPDGSLLATCAADKFARVFDAKTGKIIRSFEGHTNHVLGVAWNHTGRTLATSGADDVIKVWSLESGQQIRTIPGFTKQATRLRYVGYDATFAVAAGGVPVRTVGEGGNVVRNFDSGGTFMYDLSLSADGQTMAAGGLDGILHIWNVAETKAFAAFGPPGSAAASVK